jgi:GNAT superfamily N-acetyltransferase
MEGELSAEFSLGFWDSPYPEERLQEMAGLLQVVANDQPRDALDMEDINYTPDSVRQFDAAQRAGGDQRWTLTVTARKDGGLAGISEVYWNANRPAILWQGFTGVMPEHRNRGLGRWLKAVMLEKILRERPEVRVIRSGNASSNAPMLKINRALGFEQLVGWAIWQVELDSVDKYLAARAWTSIAAP